MKGVCIFRNSTTRPVAVRDPFPSDWTGRESPASEMDSMCGGGEVVVAEGGGGAGTGGGLAAEVGRRGRRGWSGGRRGGRCVEEGMRKEKPHQPVTRKGVGGIPYCMRVTLVYCWYHQNCFFFLYGQHTVMPYVTLTRERRSPNALVPLWA
jgi:hypothetical protein